MSDSIENNKYIMNELIRTNLTQLIEELKNETVKFAGSNEPLAKLEILISENLKLVDSLNERLSAANIHVNK